MWKIIFLCLLFVTPASFAAEDQDKAIHDELRAITAGVVKAVNARKYDQIAQYFHEKMRVTMINQNFLVSHEAIEPYFEEWFGKGGFLKSLEMELKPDAETVLYNNKQFGIVHGDGIEHYKLSDGRTLDMKTRWTATVVKDTDGKWKILALHIGTNFYNNPMFHALEDAVVKTGLGGAAGGLLVGGLVVWFIMRRRKSAAV